MLCVLSSYVLLFTYTFPYHDKTDIACICKFQVYVISRISSLTNPPQTSGKIQENNGLKTLESETKQTSSGGRVEPCKKGPEPDEFSVFMTFVLRTGQCQHCTGWSKLSISETYMV